MITSLSACDWSVSCRLTLVEKKNSESLSAGFEPARGDPNGFLVHRLNHSATTTDEDTGVRKEEIISTDSVAEWEVYNRKQSCVVAVVHLISEPGGSVVPFEFHQGCYEHSTTWWRWASHSDRHFPLCLLMYKMWYTVNSRSFQRCSLMLKAFTLFVFPSAIYSQHKQSNDRVETEFSKALQMYSKGKNWLFTQYLVQHLWQWSQNGFAHVDFFFLFLKYFLAVLWLYFN